MVMTVACMAVVRSENWGGGEVSRNVVGYNLPVEIGLGDLLKYSGLHISLDEVFSKIPLNETIHRAEINDT